MGGVPHAGLAALLNAGNFPLMIIDLVVLFSDESHEALVACGERGVVEHQLLQDVFLLTTAAARLLKYPSRVLT